MASGHVNRTNRPNTWLHRPACKREEKPCQLGAVHTWHRADISRQSRDVRFESEAAMVYVTACRPSTGASAEPRSRGYMHLKWSCVSTYRAALTKTNLG